MAEEETKEEQEQGQKKSSNMLMIIIIAVLVLIIIVGAVLAVVLMNSEEQQAATQSTYQTQGRSIPETSTRRQTSSIENSRRLSEIGILYPLDTFTVNLKSDAGRRYLKATISLELSGEELSLELDAKAPVIRDRIIRILTSKTLEEISSKKGKQKVSNQVIDTLNSIVSDGTVQGIYFTEFVIQ